MSATIRYCYIGLLAVMLLANVIDVPVYLHMITTTMLIIYIGSHQSVVAEESLEGIERMSSKDAYMFPVIGSIFLFSLYVVFKVLPKEYVNIVIKAYFFVFGVFILANNIHKLVNLWVDKSTFERWDAEIFRCRIPFFGHKPEDKAAAPAATTGVKKVTVAPSKGQERAPLPSPNPKAASDGSTIFSKLDIVCYLLAVLFGVWYVAVNHWSATNVFGIFFSIQGIEFLSLGSFFNGVVLLSGLFVYDVFWVFGTDVMVTVAKSFDAPIKLLFPRPAGASPSMLGLGDIVIPGIFIALMLRFDYNIAANKNSVKTSHFYSVMVGYFVGLSTTVGVMYHFQAAQPALLYLVPTCLGSAVLCAVATGNFSKLWAFSEGEPAQAEHRDEDLANKAPESAASASDADEGAVESADSAAESSAAEDNDEASKPSGNARLRRSRSRKDN